MCVFLENLFIYPIDDKHRSFNKNRMSMLHINGVSGHFDFNFKFNDKEITSMINNYINHTNPLDSFVLNIDNQYIDFLIELFLNHNQCCISYAWEDGNNSDDNSYADSRLEDIQNLVKDTNILVIIGYSFPFFNREIDNHIFNSLDRYKLQKVYFQDPTDNNGHFLYERFPMLKEQVPIGRGILSEVPAIPIIHITDCNQYYVPVEL